MWNPEKTYVRDINDFLVKHDAKIFGYDTWRLLIQRVRNGVDIVPTMILAPSDKALEELSQLSNRTWQEIYQSQEGKDILENHVSIKETQKHWPMFTAINGKQYGSGQADLLKLEPTASTVIQVSNFVNIVVIVINKVILHDDQLNRLKKSRVGYSVWQRIKAESIPAPPGASELQGNEIAQMGRDIFRMMVTDQNIRGRDLLALCTGNQAIAILCDRDDQLLFKKFLKEEFNFNYDKGFAKESPRELYAKFHAYRVEVYLTITNDFEPVGIGYTIIKQDEKRPIDEALQEFKSMSETIALPVEGWFAKNFNKPYVSEVVGSRDSREDTYLIYVHGKPESASLIRRKSSLDLREIRSHKFELSNDWFVKYFRGRSFAVNDHKFRTATNAESLIRLLLQVESNNRSIKIQTFDSDEVIIFVLLGNNEMD